MNTHMYMCVLVFAAGWYISYGTEHTPVTCCFIPCHESCMHAQWNSRQNTIQTSKHWIVQFESLRLKQICNSSNSKPSLKTTFTEILGESFRNWQKVAGTSTGSSFCLVSEVKVSVYSGDEIRKQEGHFTELPAHVSYRHPPPSLLTVSPSFLPSRLFSKCPRISFVNCFFFVINDSILLMLWRDFLLRPIVIFLARVTCLSSLSQTFLPALLCTCVYPKEFFCSLFLFMMSNSASGTILYPDTFFHYSVRFLVDEFGQDK